jgi:tRNA wybutosine-synthesizing protein 3
MNWGESKTNQLNMKDNSDIGKWDKKIKKLCDKINKNKSYYTTSSCAGRIVLIKQNEKKKPGLFLFRSHEKVRFSQIKKELNNTLRKEKGNVYFKQEPCVLAVACKNLKDAQNLINKAKLAGWKNSGIMSSSKRFVCEMRSTEKIELPLINKGKILVNENYLKLLLQESNKKLERTWKKIKNLEKIL